MGITRALWSAVSAAIKPKEDNTTMKDIGLHVIVACFGLLIIFIATVAFATLWLIAALIINEPSIVAFAVGVAVVSYGVGRAVLCFG